MKSINSEVPAVYAVDPMDNSDNETIRLALNILIKRMQKPGAVLSSPGDTKAYLQLQLANKPAECFSVLFLDNRHRVIEFSELFQGTIDGASVHPREVVRACIRHNAAAVVFSHNHPSGVAEASDADRRITRRLKDSLSLIDVRVLDHIIVTADETFSFAEGGLI